MTPAINLLKKHKITFTAHQFDADPIGTTNVGDEASQKLGIKPEQMFKTLLAADESDPKKLLVALVPVVCHLDLKKLAKASGIKKMNMADVDYAQKVTGYLKGGISPLGQKKKLTTFIHNSATEFDYIYVSGGKRGLSLQIKPQDIIQLLSIRLADIAVLRPEY
ncbi:Cys-tRNA(Pro) deacylase [Paraferrimonas sp. SM1919]|uniref:Cys-tRNA(Pro) deacylase n=1 Tax=Paraferrimonas sp. SM1919 TaxID=2662263 RepID=UPI0013D1079A|nr:Cys-tRNA(Pro) deacylase [Paraferrimonas sp. SM1919]